MREIIIGDIHGCNAALNKLLAKLQPDPRADKLIFLGDLFDRGSNSWEVFKTVQSLCSAFGANFVLLRGNHEDYLLQDKLSLFQRLTWKRVGRDASVRSFKQHGERFEACAPWIRSCSATFYNGSGFCCVHAGLKVYPPEMNDSFTLMHDHDVTLRNSYAGPLAICGHIALDAPKWFAGDRKTVKELPYDEELPLPERGIICLDTGCGKGGWLTGMTIDHASYRLYGALDKS